MFEEVLEDVGRVVHLREAGLAIDDLGWEIESRVNTCGTHFGETNEPASMVDSPVFARRSISSSLVARGMAIFSFCRPSRGPTSTSLTRLSKDGRWSDAVAKVRALRMHGWQRRSRRGSSANLAIVCVVQAMNPWRGWGRGAVACRSSRLMNGSCRVTSHSIGVAKHHVTVTLTPEALLARGLGIISPEITDVPVPIIKTLGDQLSSINGKDLRKPPSNSCHH